LKDVIQIYTHTLLQYKLGQQTNLFDKILMHLKSCIIEQYTKQYDIFHIYNNNTRTLMGDCQKLGKL